MMKMWLNVREGDIVFPLGSNLSFPTPSV